MSEWGKSCGTYKDEDGKEWIINLEVNYVETGSQDFQEGDNSMDLSKIYEINSNGKETRSKMDGGDKQIYEKTPGGYRPTGKWDLNTAGNSGTMRGGRATIENGFNAFHELLHLYGLSDRYEENEYVPPQYQSDVMSCRGVNIHQNHGDNWGKAALRENGNFILKYRVDITGGRDLKYIQPENTATKRGTR